jgi:hypothetical protein
MRLSSGIGLIFINIMVSFYPCSGQVIIGENGEWNLSRSDGLIIRNEHYQPQNTSSLPEVTDWEIPLIAPMNASLRIADIDGDSILDIIATTYAPPPNPYWGGQIFVKDINGNDVTGWPFETTSPFSCAAAIGDVDNDGDMEIAAGSWNSMFLLNHDGSYYEGWPVGNGVNYSPTLADLDNDNDLEIIYPSGSILYVRHHDGSYFDGFPVTAPEDLGSPAVGDIDDDGQLEIVGCTLAGPVDPDPYEIYAWELDGSVMPGFPVATSGVVKSTPALADVNNDGFLEIVVAAYHSTDLDYIYCVDYQGNQLDGWPVRAGYCRLSSPALADIDNDGDLEIFIGGLQTAGGYTEILYGYDYQGNSLEGWPVLLPHDGGAGNINSSPVVAEIDDDPDSPEIFVKTYNNIFGLNADGSYIEGFPYAINDDGNTGTYSPSPAIGDLDNDGEAELIFASSSGRLYLVDWTGTYDADRSDWPMYKHDQWGSSRYGGGIFTSIGGVVLLPESIELGQNYPNPFNARTTIRFTLDKPSKVNIAIYNLLGRRIDTIINEVKPSGMHSVVYDASALASGIYFYNLTAGEQTKTGRMILLK